MGNTPKLTLGGGYKTILSEDPCRVIGFDDEEVFMTLIGLTKRNCPPIILQATFQPGMKNNNMPKTDNSIHNICIAAIKRSTMKPYDFKWTRFYEENVDLSILFPGIEVDLSPDELVICSTLIDSDNFSILTTQKLITKEKGSLVYGSLLGATNKLYGDFKGIRNKEPFTFGMVQLENGSDLKYFIETGKASMVMIYGVSTWIQINAMTTGQVDKVARIWTRRNEQ
jgi:hypothetical protein